MGQEYHGMKLRRWHGAYYLKYRNSLRARTANGNLLNGSDSRQIIKIRERRYTVRPHKVR